MADSTEQIKRYIVEEKDHLGANLTELETRAKDLVDWRVRFQKDPKVMLGIAFGGGLLLASVIGGRRSKGRQGNGAAPDHSRSEGGYALGRFQGGWDQIQDALVGVVSTKALGFLSDVIPGFKDEIETTRGSSNGDRHKRSIG